MIDKEKLSRRFSKNAKNYDRYAKVQKKMGKTLINLVGNRRENVDEVTSILEIGCGTGYVTKLLNARFPKARITAVDIAPGMIEQVGKKKWNDSIKFICGDIEEIKLSSKYDLIVSNATFQWFNNMSKTIVKLVDSLNDRGNLVFSTFGEQTFTELHQSFEETRKVMKIEEQIKPGQKFYNLEELTQVCQRSLLEVDDFHEMYLSKKETMEYEYFDTVQKFLNSIKKIGANNSNEDNTIVSPDFIKKAMGFYDENFKENNKIKATYHCLFMEINKM